MFFLFFGDSCAREPKKPKNPTKTNPEGLCWGAGPPGKSLSGLFFFGFFGFFVFFCFFFFGFFVFFWFFWFFEDFCALLEILLYHFLLYGFSVSSEGCFLGFFFRLLGVISFSYAFFVQLFLVFVFCVCFIFLSALLYVTKANLDNQAHGILCFSHLVGDERFSLGPALHKFKQR